MHWSMATTSEKGGFAMVRVRAAISLIPLMLLTSLATGVVGTSAARADPSGRPPDWTGGGIQQEPDPRSATLPPPQYEVLVDNPALLQELQLKAQRSLQTAQAAARTSRSPKLSA